MGETLNFADAVGVWGEVVGSTSRIHISGDCHAIVSTTAPVFHRRYSIDSEKICTACGHELLTSEASSEKLARLYQLEAQLRRLERDLTAEYSVEDASRLSRLKAEVEAINTVLPQAQALRENLIDDAARVTAHVRESARQHAEVLV